LFESKELVESNPIEQSKDESGHIRPKSSHMDKIEISEPTELNSEAVLNQIALFNSESIQNDFDDTNDDVNIDLHEANIKTSVKKKKVERKF
jgi:hypothetical protein